MKTPLIATKLPSIYKKNGTRLNLPERMAKTTPDTINAINSISTELKAVGGELYLSDLFRSYDMQQQAHNDYVSGKKKAYSPPPGGSMHEAGRAFDLDLEAIKVPLSKFWEIAKKYGVYPIINTPNSSLNEAWHFDCVGSHNKVYQYYATGKATNMKPYQAMAASAILAIGIEVDMFKSKRVEASIQSSLIRLGYDIGSIDGVIGEKTKTALKQAGVNSLNLETILLDLENLLQQQYPQEFISQLE